MNSRYPGATHDSSIWKSCVVYAHMVDEHNTNPDNKTWLLGKLCFNIFHCEQIFILFYSTGDSGYPLQPWLMTPVMNPRTDAEKHYNKMHAKTRSKVERCIGVLKNRFRCLLGERKLLYSHQKASKIIVSCVVLHNYMNNRGDLDLNDNDNLPEYANDDNENAVRANVCNHRVEGMNTRNHLIATLFEHHQ